VRHYPEYIPSRFFLWPKNKVAIQKSSVKSVDFSNSVLDNSTATRIGRGFAEIASGSENADFARESSISHLKNGFCTWKCKFPVGNDDFLPGNDDLSSGNDDFSPGNGDLSDGNGDIYLEMTISHLEMAIFQVEMAIATRKCHPALEKSDWNILRWEFELAAADFSRNPAAILRG
jgi:hypothetical protein